MGKSAGRMNAYVEFIRDSEVSDGMGGSDLTPEVLWEGPVEIERLQSFRGDVERMTAGAVGAHPIVRIHVRYDDATATLTRYGNQYRCRDVDSGITMNISFAQDMTGRREMVVVTATENLPS
jgi:head-tail adaptor